MAGLKFLSVACSAIYFVTIPFHPYTGSAVIKGLSIATLAVLAWMSAARLLSLALAASAAGDVLLDLDPARLFVAGLCAFLAAHVVYTILFVSRRRRPAQITGFRLAALIAVPIYAAGFSVWLAPSLGAMTVPVAIYICVITAMAACSIGARLPILVPTGAVLFLLSDSMLATAKFKGTFALRDYLVWATYYGAQYSIASGMLAAKDTRRGFTGGLLSSRQPRREDRPDRRVEL
jgi:uncharacterized membrane protein YhhN